MDDRIIAILSIVSCEYCFMVLTTRKIKTNSLVMLRSGLVKFRATGPTGLVLFKVNVGPCERKI